jgi:hypothetical protein
MSVFLILMLRSNENKTCIRVDDGFNFSSRLTKALWHNLRKSHDELA